MWDAHPRRRVLNCAVQSPLNESRGKIDLSMEEPKLHAEIAPRWAERGRPLVFGLVVVAAVLGVYWTSLPAPFTLDDYRWILFNGRIRTFEYLIWNPGPRPVVQASLWLNYSLGQVYPVGYRLFNVLVHCAAALVLMDIVRRTLRLISERPGAARWADLLALQVALIWALHPLQTQSVTYVIQRCESMMGMFYLLCLYGLLRGSQSKKAWLWYALSIVALALGLRCKAVIVTAPVLLLLFDRAYLAAGWREILRKRWDVYLGLMVIDRQLLLVAYDKLTSPRTISQVTPVGPESVTPWEYLSTQPQVILHYLRLALWPDVLCFDYRWPIAASPWEIYVPGGLVVGLLLLSLLAYIRRPRVGFLCLAFFIILAPTSSFAPLHDLAAEHRMYLPLAPLAVLFVLAWHAAFARWLPPKNRLLRIAPHALLIVVAIALGTRTVYRNRDYLDPVLLWSTVLEVAPHNKRAAEWRERHQRRNW